MTAVKGTGKVQDFPLFDWLRIAMALIVVAFHFSLITWSNAGNMAVQVFFALSGWLIGAIILEIRQNDIPLFYFNRTTRVWIPYAFSVLILYSVSALKDPITTRWLEFLFYDVTFTHNFFSLLPNFKEAHQAMPLAGTGNHFWSLSVEEQFYLIAPLAIIFVKSAKNTLFWILIAIITGIFRSEFSAIALGVAAASAHRQYPNFHNLQTSKIVISIVSVLSICGIFCYQHLYNYIVPIFSVSIVLLLAIPGRRGSLGKFLGGVSYPIYLNHWIALLGMSVLSKRVGGDPKFWAMAGMFVAFGIGTAAYFLIDRFVFSRRRKWYSPGVGWACALMSYVLVGAGVAGGLIMRVL